MAMNISNTKIEAIGAIVGAVMGAAGALLIDPIVMVIGLAVAGIVTLMRINDRNKKPVKQAAHATYR